jgi:putative tricarboxylic transport membrane protein
VPSGAGGGWDQTGRALQQAFRLEKISSNVQVTNVPGVAGTIGLAQFATTKQGRPNALLVGGFSLVSAVITSKSAVSVANVTSIARLIGDYEILVVPANSPIRNVADLVVKLKSDTRAVSWAGGSAGSTDHVFTAVVAEAAGADVSKLNYVAHAGGGEAMTSILGDHVSVGVGGWNEYKAQIRTARCARLALPRRNG